MSDKNINNQEVEEFRFNGVVFVPEAEQQLRYDGKKVSLKPQSAKLLRYFVENPNRKISHEAILNVACDDTNVTYNVVSKAVSVLNGKLPAGSRIENIPRVGYRLDTKVTRVVHKYPKAEYLLKNSVKFRLYLNAFVVMGFALIAVFGSYAFTKRYAQIYPPPRFAVEGDDTLFTWDFSVKTPQLSPDGRFIAYPQSRYTRKNDRLSLFDLTTRSFKQLVPMGFYDGFKWNLTGDKIVYQNTTSGKCEIRLLTFHNADKTDYSHKHLADCYKTSGKLSFAWYSDDEFYVNLTSKEEITSANKRPQHHIYSFNIDTKRLVKHATADYKSGFGFYGLEYDQHTQKLYFLAVENYTRTYFYAYTGDHTSPEELAEVDYYVRFLTVNNNTLIYKNNRNRFVINQPADDFDGEQELMRGHHAVISQPYLINNHFVYVAGGNYGFDLQEVNGQDVTPVNLQGIYPHVLANYGENLIFASPQMGMYQVYMRWPDGNMKQISKMTENEPIMDIAVKDDIFVISHIDKVALYQFNGETFELEHVKTLEGYRRGLLNDDGSKLLLTEFNRGDEAATFYEKPLGGFLNFAKQVAKGKLAFYHQGELVYINKAKELIRKVGKSEQVIARNINTKSIEYTDVSGDDFYYIEHLETAQNINLVKKLHKVNLITGDKTTFDLGKTSPSKVQILNGQVLVRTSKTLSAKMIKAEVKKYQQ